MFRKKRPIHSQAHHKTSVQKPIERAAHIQTEVGFVKTILRWFLQAKGTLIILIAIVASYLYSLTLSKEAFEALVFTKEAFFSQNFFPMVAGWFLHANLAHLAGNIIALLVFGRIVEKRFGTFRFFLIYFIAALSADMVATVIFGETGIGASGAIYGLMAAAMLVNPFYITFSLLIPMPIVVVGWLYALTDILGVVAPQLGDNTGHIAHLSAFFIMSILVYMFSRKDEKIRKGLFINIVTALVLAFVYFYYPQIALSFLSRV